MARVGIRAVAILIKGGQVLLMHRTRNGKEFWVFPGGGVEENESVEEAVARLRVLSENLGPVYNHVNVS